MVAMKRKLALFLMPSAMPWFWVEISCSVGSRALLSSPIRSLRYRYLLITPTLDSSTAAFSPEPKVYTRKGSPFCSRISVESGRAG